MTRALPQAGEIWRHFKGREYKIVCIAFLATPQSPAMVVYTAASSTDWVRPLEEFMSDAPHTWDTPITAQHFRFEKVSNGPAS